jgi:hypothetical protein
MKILYIADGRSPIALNWICYFIHKGYAVHLASTFPCQPLAGLASLRVIPVGFSGVYSPSGASSGTRTSLLRKLIPVSLRTRIRQLGAPITFSRAAKTLGNTIGDVQPDLIHAMRIPYEGMIASMALMGRKSAGRADPKFPLIVSVWGNDFTLHARSSHSMERYTSQTLLACDALHTDCKRDLDLAQRMGFAVGKPCIVLPGSGGVKLDLFYPVDTEQHKSWNGTEISSPVTIINPRGFRAYVRNDTFFHAIPMVLKKYPEARFICPGMVDETQAHQWTRELGIGRNVDLLPSQTQQEMAAQFRQSQISVSITTHDGTPNTLLEAMACGCFPIVGDLESLREWITPGVNGLLVDPGNPEGLAKAIITAIENVRLRQQAFESNLQLVKERAEYEKTMKLAEDFYLELGGA